MSHFLKNTPAMKNTRVLPMFLVEVINQDGKTDMITVHAENEKDAKVLPFFAGKPTGLVFPIVDLA